jgi:hypothetical protein
MKMKVVLTIALGATTAVAAGCRGPATDQAAEIIFTGGPIITINDAAPSAEAVAVKDGKILSIVAKADVLKTRGTAHQGLTRSG